MGDTSREFLIAGGKLLDDALAKRQQVDPQSEEVRQHAQSYRGHVVDVYHAWCGLKDIYAQVIARVARRHGLTLERILQSSLLCVVLHDLGKLTENFQRMMRAPPHDDGAYRKAVQQNFRHEVVPLWLVFKLAAHLGKRSGPIPGGGLIETFAVAGHHKYLADGYLLDDAKFRNPVTWPNGDFVSSIAAGLELASAMFAEQGWELPLIRMDSPAVVTALRNALCGQTNEGVGEPFCFLERCQDDLARLSGGHRRSAAAVRDLFVLLKGLLMTADWMASGSAIDERPDAFRDVVRVPVAAVREHLAARVERAGRGPFSDFKTFQKGCGESEGHVLAIAPTGSGKTEAALLWALRQAEAGHARKLLFLLPTMVTTNSLHERMETFFKSYEHEVGLVHSTADLIREDAADEGDDARADVRASLLRERHFFPPVTVATVDQLLTPLLHSGRWAMKTLAAGGAAVVIDEIHAYDPHTAGLITLMIEQLRPLGTRFMVMSATMPKDLRETICRSLGGDIAVETIEDKELLGHARNLWSVRETPLSEWLLERNSDDAVPSKNIRRLLRETNDRGEPQRVLIVVNTVKRCQELAAALREFDPVCYHSKFIFDDRREKERQILEQRPRLLIATQVVEVSLDIDYDVLLTECAPIDALVQRAGRVNRPRRDTCGKVVVHPAEEESGLIYDKKTLGTTWEALRKGNGSCLTESQLAQMVEEVYDGRRLADEHEYQAVRDAVPQHQERLHGVLDSPRPEEREALGTRLERYPQVSVIPSPFLDDVYGERCVRNPSRRRRYELKMPVWYFKKFMVVDGNPDHLPVVEMNYDSVLGGRFRNLADRPPTSSLIY